MTEHRLGRRTLLASGAAGLGAHLLAGCDGPGTRIGCSGLDLLNAGGPAPNILLIVTDQERVPYHFDLDAARLAELQPALRTLMSEGVSFQNHNATSTICSPARASIYTGLGCRSAGMVTNLPHKTTMHGNAQEPMDPAVPTIGRVLQQLGGYHAAYKGKWHLSEYQTDLLDYGFQDWEANVELTTDYNSGTQEDLEIVDQVDQWKPPAGKPWFLAVNFVNPHDIAAVFPIPWELRRGRAGTEAGAPFNHDESDDGTWSLRPRIVRDTMQSAAAKIHAPWFSEKFRTLANWQTEDYASYATTYTRLLQLVDMRVSELLALLSAKGMLDNTIIIYTADHGEMAGAHGMTIKGNYPYKELLHVPLAITFPASWDSHAKGRELPHFTSHVDLAPTIYSLAGIPRARSNELYRNAGHHLEGEDLTGAIAYGEGELEMWGQRPIFAEVSDQTAWVRTVMVSAADGQRYKYTRYQYVADCAAAHDFEEELFALDGDDADEQDNLAASSDTAEFAALIDAFTPEGPLL